MNGEHRKKYKPRKCKLSEDVLAEIANTMTERFFNYTELGELLKSNGFKCEVNSLLNYLEARGYLIASEKTVTKCGTKTAYRVMTKEIYKKIAEEHRENAKKRLLATNAY